MWKTVIHAGLIAAGVSVASVPVAQAAGPSDECKDAAAACREAYDKLDKCQKGKDGDKKDTCAADRSATDSACKSSNSVCVGGKKAKAAHSHKSKTAQKS
jgi:hypothetical protein